MKYLILALLCLSCEFQEKPTDDTCMDSALRDKLTLSHQGLLSEAGRWGVTGWPSTIDCDATLWAGLARYGGADTDLDLAEYSPGEIHRRPFKACWNDQDGDVGSKSTVSNDMIIGYLLGRHSEDNTDAINRFYKYQSDRRGQFGLPSWRVGEVYIKQNVLGLLCRLKPGHQECDTIPELYLPTKKDYVRHISTVMILLSIESSGKYSDHQINALRRYRDADTADFMFSVGIGMSRHDMDHAARLWLTRPDYRPTYVRGKDPDAYHLARRLFGAKYMLNNSRVCD